MKSRKETNQPTNKQFNEKQKREETQHKNMFA